MSRLVKGRWQVADELEENSVGGDRLLLIDDEFLDAPENANLGRSGTEPVSSARLAGVPMGATHPDCAECTGAGQGDFVFGGRSDHAERWMDHARAALCRARVAA